jgi:transposase
MRHAQRGGYTPAEQQRRERLRLQAAERFARGDGIVLIAHDLPVTEGSVRRWHRAWRDGGAGALRSKGPVSRERLSPQQWARLEQELKKGPLAHGFAGDQRWTLGRIKTLIGKLFHVGYTALDSTTPQAAVPGSPHYGSFMASQPAQREPAHERQEDEQPPDEHSLGVLGRDDFGVCLEF